jgi:hypothetical protein
MPFNISIVEDDSVVRAGWIEIINRAPGYRSVSDFGSAEAALAKLPATERLGVLVAHLRAVSFQPITE